MKKIAILSITLLFILSVAKGQPDNTENTAYKETGKESKAERAAHHKLEGKDVSIRSKNALSEDFATATNIHWNRSDYFDEASFTSKDGKELTAFYGDDGQLVGTTQIVNFAEVPLKGQQEINKKYKDYKIGNVVFFDDNLANEADMILWAAQFDDENNYFVELTKGEKRIIVKVDNSGAISFFKQLS